MVLLQHTGRAYLPGHLSQLQLEHLHAEGEQVQLSPQLPSFVVLALVQVQFSHLQGEEHLQLGVGLMVMAGGVCWVKVWWLKMFQVV